MTITHFGHACVLLQTERARLLFDPGTFSSGFEVLTDLDAVVITHQHPDHVDLARLPALLAANPSARLVVDPGSAAGDIGDVAEHTVAQVDESLTIAGSRIDMVGGEHAVIHPDLPNVANIGYVVDDGAFYHPGDAFVVPPRDVDVLGLPTGAPWLKLSEAVEFFRAVSPRVAVPIHEAVLAMPAMHYDRFAALAPAGAAVRVLDRGVATEL